MIDASCYKRYKFQSTLPTRGSDGQARPQNLKPVYFNPRSPRGGATVLPIYQADSRASFQSTLPTRGSDQLGYPSYTTGSRISIHAPHEGERLTSTAPKISRRAFQSTLPTRGSDIILVNPVSYSGYFNPRSPRGGATDYKAKGGLKNNISIHAPHEGERQRKSAFVCSISANLLNIIHCGTVTRAVSRRRIALFRLFSVRRSGVFTYAYASH